MIAERAKTEGDGQCCSVGRSLDEAGIKNQVQVQMPIMRRFWSIPFPPCCDIHQTGFACLTVCQVLEDRKVSQQILRLRITYRLVGNRKTGASSRGRWRVRMELGNHVAGQHKLFSQGPGGFLRRTWGRRCKVDRGVRWGVAFVSRSQVSVCHH